MRKKSFLLILFTAMSVSLWSQGVKMGLLASPQVTWMQSDASHIKSAGPLVGFNFGLLSDFFFADRYCISSGINIDNSGGKLEYQELTPFKTNDSLFNLAAGTTVNYRMQYIDIPLAFKFQSNQIGYFEYYAQFGLTGQVRVNATCSISDYDLNKVGCKDEINLFNVGYNVGGGIHYYLAKNTAITVGLIYTNGFVDITNNDRKTQSDKTVLKSVTLKFGIIF
jgi:hypothetical protein